MPSVQTAGVSRRPRPPHHLFGPLKVLVVDDMPTIRRMLRQMLAHLGFSGGIREAADGLEAWELLCQEPADVVVCDINMPRMNGLELLRLLRATPRFETTPFLLVTGEVSEDIVAASAENEVDAYILKPFKVASLEQRLRTIVQNRHHPSPGEAAFLKAKKLLAARRPQEASLLLEKLLAPPYRLQAKVLNLLGECYLALGESAEAATCFNQALELNPRYLKAYHNLALLFEARGDLASARHCLQEAQKISPLNPERLFHLGDLAWQSGDADLARSYWQDFLKTGHPVPPERTQEIAESFLAAGLTEAAERLFRQALSKSPQDARLYNRLGVALRRQHKHLQALEAYRQALHLNPKDPKVHFNLGVLYLDLNHRDQAQAAFRQALALHPDFPEARDFLAAHFPDAVPAQETLLS